MIHSNAIQITPEILVLIAKIDEFKGVWRTLGTLAPERLLALRRVATIESIGSSTRIEGSKLSDREVERLLSNLQIKTFATRDEQEVVVRGVRFGPHRRIGVAGGVGSRPPPEEERRVVNLTRKDLVAVLPKLVAERFTARRVVR